ncbi:hypothetical protein [Nocardiopsis sp. HUAS JQ3]|uniref:hypothetical protein n=1 Tax=Nocardiopsis sp. HUAS JQ3 TaxID=3061629 RepID=UPI0023A9E899|nr:hypothetical protein [Nocardiopsis sp. HUAS JQ3]WDZ90095.1 hypothetical protein PV789_24860 [Nocardiopsis sp. HUAS JQ3]
MTETPSQNNVRGPAQRVDAASVDAAAGAPEYDSTSRLSCAAWTDPAFRADVLRERVENPHRTLAREPGMDAARVTQECVRARSVRATAGAWFLGACLVLCLLSPAVGFSALVLTAVVGAVSRYRAARGAERPRGGCLVWLVGAVVVYLLLSVGAASLFMGVGGGGEFDASDPSTGFPGSSGASSELPEGSSLLPAWLGLLLLVGVAVGLGCWVRARTNSALDAVRARAEQAWKGSGVGTVPVAFYSDFKPFVGAGARYDSWPVTLKLLPDRGRSEPARVPAAAPSTPSTAVHGTEDSESAPALAGADLVERLYARLRAELPALTGTEGVHSSTRREVEVADCVFLPGLRQDDVVALAPRLIEQNRWRLREEWVRGFVEVFHERARHFLEVGISMWESQVVVTVFVRLSTQGGLLHVEGETLVMPPISPEYGMPAGPLPTGADAEEWVQLAWQSLLGVVDDLRTNPVEALAWVGSRNALRKNDRLHAWAREHGEFFDYAPRMGVRERAATDGLQQLFQSHDVRRVTRAIPEKVLVCVRDVLREAGYDTEQVARIIQTFNHYGAHFSGGKQTITGGDFSSHNTINEPPSDDGAQTPGKTDQTD